MSFEQQPIPVERSSFNLTPYDNGEKSDIFEDMTRYYGSSVAAAEQFAGALHGEHGTALADAPNLEAYKSRLSIAMNSDNMQLAELGKFGIIGSKYGHGIVKQQFAYLSHFPEDAPHVINTFVKRYKELEESCEVNDSNVVSITDQVLRGIRIHLATEREKGRKGVPIIADEIYRKIFPEWGLINAIMLAQQPTDNLAQNTQQLERMATNNKLQHSSHSWFLKKSFELTKKAIELQNDNAPTEGSKFLNHELGAVANQVLPAQGPSSDQYTKLYDERLNKMLKFPVFGLDQFELRMLTDNPRSRVSAIDRMIFIATHRLNTLEVPSSDFAKAAVLVRSIGHSARMFTELGLNLAATNASEVTRTEDLKVRYPLLNSKQQNKLHELFEQGETSRYIHKLALKMTT